MSLAAPVVMDNGAQRAMIPGDILNTCEGNIQSIANAAGVVLTAAQMLASLLLRSGAAGVSDTTPDANSWVAALLQNMYQNTGSSTPNGVPVGTTYRWRVSNANTGTLTLVAGTGVTLSGTTTIPTVNYREYLVTVLNGTPSQIFAASTTNGSAVITGLSAAQTALLSPGMGVSGTGIAGGSTILSVQPGVGVTLSANATATGALVALTFVPQINVRGLFCGPV